MKLLSEKILIYYKENSKKANVIYDLAECSIKGNYFRDKSEKLDLFNNLKKTPTTVSLSKPRIDANLVKKRKSSGALHSFSTASNLEEDNEVQDTHLNYLIEIDHPYQKKCQMKGDHIFESVEFFKKIKRIIE